MNYLERVSELTSDGPALVVGVDPHPQVLEGWGFTDSASGLHEFVREILVQLSAAEVKIVKPQVALFERHGLAGLHALHELLGALRANGTVAIGDSKRGDIGSTMRAYADAWLLPGADFEVDALTVNPYLGVGALLPALELAAENSKGLFVLAATSNPEALSLQGARHNDGRSVAARVIEDVAAWCASEPGAPVAGIGVVVGATVDQHAMGLNLEHYPTMPILAPGYGAQGASLGECRSHFPHAKQVFPVAARSLLEGARDHFVDMFKKATSELGGR